MPRNLNSQFQYAIQEQFTPGVSKYQTRQAEGREASMGRIFSYSEKDNLKKTAKVFSAWIKENYSDVKQIKQIRPEHIKEFLSEKSKSCTQKTIEQYASRLQKLGILASKTYVIKTHMDVSVKEARETYKAQKTAPEAEEVRIRTIAMKTEDYEKIMSKSSESVSKAAVETCRAFGLRVSEVVAIKPEHVHTDRLEIIQAKGGRDRTLYAQTPLQKQELQRLEKKASEASLRGDKHVYEIKAGSVNKWLSRALEKAGISEYKDAKTSIHAIRKLYATERYESLRASGLNHRDAWGTVSSELGHSKDRMELFKVYVRK